MWSTPDPRNQPNRTLNFKQKMDDANTSTNDVIDKLRSLASNEKRLAAEWVSKLDNQTRSIFFMEVCRVMNLSHVRQTIKDAPGLALPTAQFDTMVKGWNGIAALLLPYAHLQHGIPLMTSNDNTRFMAYQALYNLGTAAVAEDVADMLWYGLLTPYEKEGILHLKVDSNRTKDHFLDRIEPSRIIPVEQLFEESINEELAPYFSEDWVESAKKLIRPFFTNSGVMMGYDMTPEMDDHFLALTLKATLKWRDSAGIHPDADFNGVSGSDLFVSVAAVASFHLKHIHFVQVGMELVENANFTMSLSIWHTRDEIIDTIAAATSFSQEKSEAILDILTAKSSDWGYFANETTPYLPLYIQISSDQLLCNVSAIFQNPLHGIRMVQERDSQVANAVRAPRENWMQKEIYDLFRGNRYQVVVGQIKLKSKSVTSTDIDAAILDTITGDIALFQLKWQDFNSHSVKSQFSKAKNFSEQTSKWANRVWGVLEETEMADLHRKCRFVGGAERTKKVHLFAVGRVAARFKSYGFTIDESLITVCSFLQLKRLRHELDRSRDVFSKLREAIMRENRENLERKSVAHILQFTGSDPIVLDDIWSE